MRVLLLEMGIIRQQTLVFAPHAQQHLVGQPVPPVQLPQIILLAIKHKPRRDVLAGQ